MSEPAKRPWLRIRDEVYTSEELATEIEHRVDERRAKNGAARIAYPKFGHISEYPEPPTEGGAYNPDLYFYLKQANRETVSLLEPVLLASPATRIPILGSLWKLFRAQFHGLILFYVNRSVGEQSRLNVYLVSALNELARTTQAQQAEIDRLRSELHLLRQKKS